ncbi:ComF family protein [Candidatus Daviesbacteria bacterium]|nr:ComF family protein [Candidatus Daviesbacteria bacterium]
MNILDLLFPKKCVGCNKLGAYFCPGCISNILQAELVCPGCERPSIGGVTHPVCRRKFGLDGLWSLGVYSGSLRSAIQKIKYRYIKELAEDLVDITLEYWAKSGTFLLDEIKKNYGKDWVVVPVPLHWTRKNSRGFNQSSLFAKVFADRLGLDYSEALKRHKMTSSQVGLDSQKRRQNIKNTFSLTMNHELITNNTILVDDVWTTGSTLKECCYVLKRNGAKKVWSLTLAR